MLQSVEVDSVGVNTKRIIAMCGVTLPLVVRYS